MCCNCTAMGYRLQAPNCEATSALQLPRDCDARGDAIQ